MNRRYLAIYEEIRQGIIEGVYPPGEKLPSENDFCKKFETSRGTIRRALDMLAEEGLVNSMHGKGVFVLDQNTISFSFGGLVSFKEANENSGLVFSTTVPFFTELVIDKKLEQKTHLPNGIDVYHLYRVRKLDGERVILDINYFSKEKCAGLTPEIAEKSIYDYIENDLELKIGFAQRVIQVEQATGKDREYLDMKAFGFVVVVRNYVHLYDGTIFEYTESRHRPDRFVFTDFARRR
ncbi:trehalose operon repressor [Brevibacillus sp. 7WMA2]|uniref:trehalose operon repressor n=1 Tax=Brevibacillus TaxID=55080 RepID=UPI0013A72FF1|nr:MULTISPECIES: trehalose operon repressor [Brevibacillus]MBA4531494.1 trehalose operon repressor [Brevibacillus halotolerans]MCR8994326.1 trehalose operon repressor [Brevibacillus laterosporus]QIC07772.1 trehalose operon repressor [Brevibacillus sp. 7WMA2]WPS88752.1 trehalose operon repressor [Brevibacillus halotolerans]